ncbi:MAG: hypothetical protein IT581_20295 [Verrucomicrobiales bacterium]|nr:hypothetical protein [Verrucomicrobiales bacterium]
MNLQRHAARQGFPGSVPDVRWGPMVIVGLWLLLTGCSPSTQVPTATYPDINPGSAAPTRDPEKQAVPNWKPAGALVALESALSPATLWRSDSNRFECFVQAPGSGLGEPTFLAYSSPTGIAVIKPGTEFAGSEMRENWLLTGYPGALGWEDWDSPWAVFLQHRPQRVEFGTNGIRCEFSGEAGFFATMPIYGYYKPPQKGRDFLSRHGMKEKKLLTWEWAIVVARDPLTRVRYWSGVTRRFPVDCRETFVVDRRRDTVTWKHRFDWLEIPDDWGTRPIRLAPVNPALGLALTKGQSFPATFSRPPFDYEIPTPAGPYFGIAEVDDYEVSFPVLKYLNETEAPAMPIPGNAPAKTREALARLRSNVASAFANPATALSHGAPPGDDVGPLVAAHWYAQSLPYLEDASRRVVVQRLGSFFRDEMLVQNRIQERLGSNGSGRTHESSLLQALWAYAHRSGDAALIRERWPLIRGLWDLSAPRHWATLGAGSEVELGDGAAPVAAMARLAFIAGDQETYHRACGFFVRELVQLYARQRGVQWIRELQPWHSMEPVEGEVYFTTIDDAFKGWQISGPIYPREVSSRPYQRRWVRFQDLDAARFLRDRVAPDLRQELDALKAGVAESAWGIDDPLGLPSTLRMNAWLSQPLATNVLQAVSVEALAGPPSGVVAGCLAVLRTSSVPRWERLFPGAEPSEPVALPDAATAPESPGLLQRLTSAGEVGGWPEMEWPAWKTPVGKAWTFGAVRAGDSIVARREESRPWNGVTQVTTWRANP